MNRHLTGALLIELLVVCLIMVIIGAGLVVMLQTNYASATAIQGQNVANMTVRQAMDSIADHIRNAQVSGNSVLSTASANSLTYYTFTGSTVTYALSGGRLQRTDSSGTSTVISGISNGTTPLFTYYADSGAFYNSSTGDSYSPSGTQNYWSPTADPNNPTTAELPYVAEILIQTNVVINGYARQVKTFVRLRNSPPGASKS